MEKDNKLPKIRPDIARQWHKTLNGKNKPEEFTISSNKKAFFECELGHYWLTRISSRAAAKGNGCPYCSNHKVWPGFNDFQAHNPYWANCWDYNLNTKNPWEVAKCSGTKYFFICPQCKSSFPMAISKINKPGPHCPYCAHQKALPGFNTIADVCPELIPYWDYDKNSPENNPYNTLAGGKTKYWWKCENGYDHSYYTLVDVRKKCGCPYCSNVKVLEGFNDLATTHPEISKEWDYEKNHPLTPKNVTAGFTKKVGWICPLCGNRYDSNVDNRTRGHACRECNNLYGTSFPEQALYYYIKTIYTDTILHYHDFGFELDIYIPSKATAIEFDGFKWHNKPDKIKYDLHKNEYCLKHNITLIRIRENGLKPLENCTCYIQTAKRSDNSLEEIINQVLFDLSGATHTIHLNNDSDKIYAQYKHFIKNHSLLSTYPDLVKNQWDYTRNQWITPDMIGPGSTKKVYWHCSKGHVLYKSPNNQIKAFLNNKEGCSECYRHRKNA